MHVFSLRGLGAFLVAILAVGAVVPVAFAQQWGRVEGTVTEAGDERPIPGVTVLVSGTDYGTATEPSGAFSLRLPTGRYALRFSAVGYAPRTDSVTIRADEVTRLNVTLAQTTLEMEGITVEEAAPVEVGVYQVDPQDIQNMPSPFKDGFRTLKVMPGVATNSELTQQYSVRGGGYNENLIFINGFEVYMPFRARQGEQEGLGLLNPDLADQITFYTGGFPARYGGKLSSALDVRYKDPENEPLNGSVSASFLDASAYAGSSLLDNKLGWTLGVRKARPQQFFATQDLKGDYDPDFTDVQGTLTYRFAPGHDLEVLGIYADHTFRLDPSNRKVYFGIVSTNPRVPSNLQAVWSQYEGLREDGYTTRFGGARLSNRLSDRLRVSHALAYFGTEERESFDITGISQLFIVDPGGDPNSGAGHFGIGGTNHIDRADNVVRVNTLTGRGRYQYTLDRHAFESGWSVRGLYFEDRINERSAMQTRARNQETGEIEDITIIANELDDRATSDAVQTGFYVQDAVDVLPERDRLIITGGLRADYYSFNDEWTVSPRLSAQFAYSDRLTLLGSWGLYHQEPTYRELRGKPEPGEGILDALNTDIRSQRSTQVVLGGEYFMPKARMYVRAEGYYKDLDNIISYDIEDVRVEYSGENDATGYAYGLDLQLRGEFVPGLESWFNYSFLVARERFLPEFQNAFTQGLIARPADQRHTFSAFIQDYVPGDDSWKLHMRLLYGSGLPYTPLNPGPDDGFGQVQVPGDRMSRRLTAYRRVDLGATKEILVTDKLLANPVRLDLTFEVLNVFDMQNTVSYSWVVTSGNEWSRVPKRLTPRTVNARLRLRF